MFQDVSDGFAVEPSVDGVDDRARHRHAEQRFEQFRRVGGDDRNRIALADAAFVERPRKPNASFVGLLPGVRALAVDQCRVMRKYIGRAPDERKRRQRQVIGLIFRQIGFVSLD